MYLMIKIELILLTKGLYAFELNIGIYKPIYK